MKWEAIGFAVFVAALALIFVMALFFIFCRRYEDGVVGNLSLGFMAVSCAVTLADAWLGRLELPAAPYYLLIVAAAVFLVRHGYRFAMFHWHGTFGWARPADMNREHAEA